MKKLLVILLTLAMVLPMCLVANAADEKVEVKPFMMSISDDLDVVSHNVYPKVTFWSTASYVEEDNVKVISPQCSGKTPEGLAEGLKEYFEDFPEGTRYIRDLSMRVTLENLVEDVVFMEKGIEVYRKFMKAFLESYHAIGGELDGMAVDLEIYDVFSYYLTQAAKKDSAVYDRIMSNPMYKEKIRPQLEEYGFKFWTKIGEGTPELYSVDERSGDEYTQSRQIWNTVIRNYLNSCVNEIFMDLLAEYYPNALLFDYQARTTYGWQKNMSNKGVVNNGGNYVTAGHLNYFNTYGYAPSTDFYAKNGERIYKRVPSFNEAIYEDNSFNSMLWDTIHAKNYKASAPDGKFSVILCWDNYSQAAGSYCNSPYFTEMTYHMVMLDSDPVQSYCIESEILSRDSDPEEVVQILSEQMDELTRLVGYSDRKHVATPYTWNDKYLLTGMYANGRNVWRITPDTISTGVSLEQFKVADAKDPTFSINGQTITFPGGKIIEDAKITKVGSCGYWVETAADVLPVITYSASRYEDFPAFEMDFEELESNADFNVTKITYNNCWEIKKGKNAEPKILTVDGSNVLALNGTYSIKAKTILENITAGDTYAEFQAWQVDVTVPADMDAAAEIILLDIYGTKAKAVDGGFKIAGGKVYYTQGDNYVEVPDLDVSAGGKFTVKRGLDFSNPEAFTSDYYIYDASGKLLAQVMDVAINPVDLPVQKIGMNVDSVTGEAVLLDNFKVYVEGLAADFEVYDAKTGIKQLDVETPRDRSTAYRLSWLNGTDDVYTYSVVAAYYNGGQLVEEKVVEQIQMAPGADYVSTGIVEVAEGQSVKLYARNDGKVQSGTDTPGTGDAGKDTPDKNKDKGNEDNMMLILVVAAAVFLIAVVAVCVVLVMKKPAPKADKKEN